MYRDAGPIVAEAQWIELLHAVAKGDPRALRELFEKSHPVVLAFVTCVVHDRATAERLTVDVFYDVWRRRRRTTLRSAR